MIGELIAEWREGVIPANPVRQGNHAAGSAKN